MVMISKKLFGDEHMKKIIYFCMMSLLFQVVYPSNFNDPDFNYAIPSPDGVVTHQTPPAPRPTTAEVQARLLEEQRRAQEEMLNLLRQISASLRKSVRPESPCDQQ
jgi:hypothetical protein